MAHFEVIKQMQKNGREGQRALRKKQGENYIKHMTEIGRKGNKAQGKKAAENNAWHADGSGVHFPCWFVYSRYRQTP